MLTHFLFVPNISPWQGWLFLTVAVITIAAGCISIYENRTHLS
ncbi:putative membrane protein [Escherichia coli 2-011-08_S1_C1]|nr:putative membrane protein [Escherichia coli 2-011-08_S1_C1]